jgi:hypothetical protein
MQAFTKGRLRFIRIHRGMIEKYFSHALFSLKEEEDERFSN